jgi:hypothetical protein
MLFVRVHFSPGFPLGAGFPAEQNPHVVLCMNRIPPEQKKTISLGALHIMNTADAKPDSLLSGKFLFLRNSEYRRSSSPRNTLLQIALELRRSCLSSPPAVSYHHTRANCSAGNPPPRENPGLKCNRTNVFLKKFDRKMNFEFINITSGIVQTSDLSNYTICSLPQSRETIPLIIFAR